MKLLLDTHIWIWSLLEPKKLTQRVAQALEAKSNELWLSPISIWELLVLCARKRIDLDCPATEWVEKALKKAPLREAPLTWEVALATQELYLPHRDPVDAFLMATAAVFELTFVTADRRLLATKNVPMLPNRA